MRFSKEELAGIATRLRDLPARENAKKHSKQEAVRLLGREIAELKKRGYTLEQIAQALSASGLPISTPTLKNYLQRTGRSSRKSRASAGVNARASVRKQPASARGSFAPSNDSDEI